MATAAHPLDGSINKYYFTSEDGASVKVAAVCQNKAMFEEIQRDIAEYKWKEGDYLLASYPKNGTHFMWEIMTMLLRGTADYITDPKLACMFDMVPLKKCDEIFPSPRVLNTHCRLDVLPVEFRGRKTVLVIRNPKDTSVSYYHHEVRAMKDIPSMREFAESLTYSQSVKMFLHVKDKPYGNYFDYLEYMWSLRHDPNLLIIFYEDLITSPVSSIQRVNDFMGTQRSTELVEKIAVATNFKNMKDGKVANSVINPVLQEEFLKTRELHVDSSTNGDEQTLAWHHEKLYRKGEIGDWKNYLTVAENEMFDEFLNKWSLSREIPFTY